MTADKWLMVAVGVAFAVLVAVTIKEAKAQADAANRPYWSDANRWE